MAAEGLNPEQQEAVKAPAGANLVLAGAGSGKTRVLIHRILHLLEEGAPAESILAITFTNKAAGEMKERLAAALGPAARPVWVGTFHATGARILRAHGEALGISPHFAIMSRGESLRLLKREMAAERVDPERYDPRAILERISAHKSAGRPLAEDGVPFSLESAAAKLLPRYERAAQSAGALDFDDLLTLPLKLFRENPGILSRYQSRFTEILVDEYQDTNAVQSRFVKILAGEASRVFAVGDDDQSIYGWRGADVGNIRRFEVDFPGARVYRLERNYRSSGRILQAASAVMADAPGRKEKRLLAQNPEGEPVVYIGAADPDTEAQMIFQRLAALGAGAEFPWEEAAIFYRINTQSRPLEEEARRRSVPYQVVKGQRFFDRAEVQDAAAYLRVLLRPEDEGAFARIVNRPPRGLGPVRLQEMAAGGRLDRNLAREALEAGRVRGAAAAKALETLLGVFDELSALGAGPARMTEALLARSGYQAWLRGQAEQSASPEKRKEAVRALEGVREFVRAAVSFEERIREEEGIDPGSREALARFLEEMALTGEADGMETAGGKLSLMTLHAAKGLEFRAVVIAGVQEGLLPHGRSMDSPESLEEERRLLYVGITRAKAHLLLAWAHERRVGFSGDWSAGRPSRFVERLPEEVLERVGDHRPRERAERGTFRGRGRSWYDEPGALKPASLKPASRKGAETGAAPIPQALGPFAPGAQVRHPKFGEGVVTARSGTGERAVVTVNFKEVGQKQLVLKYAPLEPAGAGVDGGENRAI